MRVYGSTHNKSEFTMDSLDGWSCRDAGLTGLGFMRQAPTLKHGLMIIGDLIASTV